VDRLTVIAHDRFDEIIKRAREPGSIVMKRLEIGEGGDVSPASATLVLAPSIAESVITGVGPSVFGVTEPLPPAYVFHSPQESRAAEVTLDAIHVT
jgi:type III restriction enzyme